MYEFSNLLSHNIYWETYFDRKMFIVQDFDWVIVFLKNPEKKKKQLTAIFLNNCGEEV